MSKEACLAFIDARTVEGWTLEVEEPGPNSQHGCLRYRIISAPKRLMKRAVQVLYRARRSALRAVLALAGALQPIFLAKNTGI